MDPLAITTRHRLLTDVWTADVETAETAIAHFTADRPLTNDCQVVFFEMDRDRHLHVNVTHKHLTTGINGWAGPGAVRDGFVHNRTFGDVSPGQIVGHIREMVFAPRV